MVRIVDAAGAPVAGIEVTFEVVGGQGLVVNSRVRTTAGGLASCGGWTLGESRGLQTLRASSQGMEPVDFLAFGLTTSADLEVRIQEPGTRTLAPGSADVISTVRATYQLSEVRAFIGESSASLSPNSQYGPYAWSGSVQGPVQAPGLVFLVVSATDTLGNSTDAAVPILLDRPPVVSVSEPGALSSLVQSTVEITASCSDDDPVGCRAIRALAYRDGGYPGNAVELAAGVGTLSATIDLSSFESGAVRVVLSGEDSAGQRTNVERLVYLEPSPSLMEIAEVTGVDYGAGVYEVAIVDASRSSVLFWTRDSAGSFFLSLLDQGSNQISALGQIPDPTSTYSPRGPLYASLAPWGAVWGTSAYTRLWREGAVTELCQGDRYGLGCGAKAGNTGLAYKGNPGFNLYWLVPATGDIAQIADYGAFYGYDIPQLDVAPDDSVVYAYRNQILDPPGVEYDIHRWKAGTDVTLTSDGSVNYLGPRTDGSVVAAVKTDRGTGGSSMDVVVVLEGGAETALPSAETKQFWVGGGSVFYRSKDWAGTWQVWRHDTDGEHQVTQFGVDSVVEAVSPDGTIALTNAGTGKRYRALLRQPLEEVGSNLGQALLKDGVLYVAIERHLLEFVP